MDAGTRRLFVITIIAIIGLGIAAALFLGGSSSGDAPLPPEASDVVGVIVGVDATGLGDVSGFTLRTGGGTILAFGLDRLQNGTEFPPGHLAEHQATAEPVRVRYVDDGGTLLALRIDDAPRPSP